MTSKECYVYIQLPNSFETVTVGRFNWTNSGTNTDVGTFVYAQSYLKNKSAISIDHYNLPLEERIFSETKNEGTPGPLRDSSPDGWGRYIIQKNTPPSEHDAIGYLLNSADDRIGALSFGHGKVPPAPVRKFNQTLQLETLITAAQKLEQDLPLDETEKSILMAGPSAGGARPKTTVEHNNNLWLVKFPSAYDKYNISRIEYATMKLAKKCGLNVPTINLIKIKNYDVFLIQRFDRAFDKKQNNFYRTHFISGLSLMNLDEKDYSNWSYIDLADQMRRWIKKPKNDLHEMFKRIIFNGLVSNTDDHPRNHGFLYGSNDYHLSPVYDLVPKPETGTTRYLAMKLGSQGRIFNLENILSQCDTFDVTVDEAKNIFNKMKALISKWHSFYLNEGLSKSDLDYLVGAFNHWDGL